MEVLQAEVSALKQLVLTSTSSPGHSGGRLAWRRHSTEHLSPCPDCNSYDCDAAVERFSGTCLHAKDSLSDESEVGVNSIFPACMFVRVDLMGKNACVIMYIVCC